jgi:hypothetical protein
MRKKVLIIAFALLILLFCFSSAYAEERVVKYDMTFVATQPDILLKFYAATVNHDREMLSYLGKVFKGKVFVLVKGDAVDWMEILPNTNYALIKVKIDGRMVTCYGFSDAFVPKR